MQLKLKFHAVPSISFCTIKAAKFLSHTDHGCNSSVFWMDFFPVKIPKDGRETEKKNLIPFFEFLCSWNIYNNFAKETAFWKHPEIPRIMIVCNYYRHMAKITILWIINENYESFCEIITYSCKKVAHLKIINHRKVYTLTISHKFVHFCKEKAYLC